MYLNNSAFFFTRLGRRFIIWLSSAVDVIEFLIFIIGVFHVPSHVTVLFMYRYYIVYSGILRIQ